MYLINILSVLECQEGYCSVQLNAPLSSRLEDGNLSGQQASQ